MLLAESEESQNFAVVKLVELLIKQVIANQEPPRPTNIHRFLMLRCTTVVLSLRSVRFSRRDYWHCNVNKCSISPWHDFCCCRIIATREKFAKQMFTRGNIYATEFRWHVSRASPIVFPFGNYLKFITNTNEGPLSWLRVHTGLFIAAPSLKQTAQVSWRTGKWEKIDTIT